MIKKGFKILNIKELERVRGGGAVLSFIVDKVIATPPWIRNPNLQVGDRIEGSYYMWPPGQRSMYAWKPGDGLDTKVIKTMMWQDSVESTEPIGCHQIHPDAYNR